MRKTIYVLSFFLVLFLTFAGRQSDDFLLASIQQQANAFPPAGTTVTNGDFDDGTGWILLNGSTISGGVATVIGGSGGGSGGGGNVGFTGSNWSLKQNDVFESTTATFTVKFRARAINGATGNLQLARGFIRFFNQPVTTEWVEYTATTTVETNTSWGDDLVIAPLQTGEEIEVDKVSAVINP